MKLFCAEKLGIHGPLYPSFIPTTTSGSNEKAIHEDRERLRKIRTESSGLIRASVRMRCYNMMYQEDEKQFLQRNPEIGQMFNKI